MENSDSGQSVSNTKDLLKSLRNELEERCVGCLLSVMIGDALGSAVEGWGHKHIGDVYNGLLRDYKHGKHMGLTEVRKGMYTDDTNSTLALASSLVENKGLLPSHAAMQYAKFWKLKPIRGYPPSAMAVMQAVLDGTDCRKTGTLCFKDGSFANGGAMRISPIGLAYRNATDEQLHSAVRMAIISSHVHPEAIDGAWLVVCEGYKPIPQG